MGCKMDEPLDQFVAEWRLELATSDLGGHQLGKRVGREEKELLQIPSEKRPVPREPSPLLVLPAGRGKQVARVPSVRWREEEEVSSPSRSLLDTLLADLVYTCLPVRREIQ